MQNERRMFSYLICDRSRLVCFPENFNPVKTRFFPLIRTASTWSETANSLSDQLPVYWLIYFLWKRTSAWGWGFGVNTGEKNQHRWCLWLTASVLVPDVLNTDFSALNDLLNGPSAVGCMRHKHEKHKVWSWIFCVYISSYRVKHGGSFYYPAVVSWWFYSRTWSSSGCRTLLSKKTTEEEGSLKCC